MPGTLLQVGELIENRYRVLSFIGSGGMGTLYRVADEAKGGEIIALKMIQLDTPLASHESLQRFRREFQVLTQMQHPNLVSVHDFGITTADQLYFTMEWIEGADLESNPHPAASSASLPIVVQCCRALAYLHARGVIHGDLKPGNVLLVGDQVKIVDFGVTLELRSPELRARYYTPGFSAPEIRLKRAIDHRIDLYSLGALWYTFLMGEPPLFSPGRGRERLLQFTLDEALQAQPEVPPAVAAIITRLLATSAPERYASANEVIEAVNEATGHAYALETRETAGSYALRTHFVNREAEIETLQTVCEQSNNHQGKLVLVGGESGVGKTRLLTELEIQAELEGARVVWGQCTERGGSAYHPWREVLRVLVHYVEGGDENQMRQVGPVLASLLPELWQRDYMASMIPPVELEPQAAQLRLNNAIVQVLQAAAGLRPTVVAIENAHWADEASLEMLRFLTRVSGLAGLLTCVTYRDDEVDSDHLLETLAGEQVQRMKVSRLSPQVTSDLVNAMLGLEKLPMLLTERVQQTTGGNAFFVQELIRSLAIEGEVLRRTVEGWQVDGQALQKIRLPDSIRKMVERRLGQLSAEAQQVLEWAAVVGLIFWEGVVAEAGLATRAEVRVALEELVDQGLVAVRDETSFAGEVEYLFFNPTVREAGYESIQRDVQQEYHNRVAKWLLAHSEGEVNQHLGLIAEHLERAGQVEQAAAFLTRAGEQAAERFANAEAISYLSHALDLTPSDELAGRYRLLLVREKVYALQGARQAQDQDLTTLEEVAEALDNSSQAQTAGARQVEVALRRISYGEAVGDYAAAIAAAQKAIGLAQAAGDVGSETRGYLELGRVFWRQGDYATARSPLEQSLALARTTGLRQVEASSLRVLGEASAQSRAGGSDEGKRFLEQSLQICREIGDRQGESEALNLLGSLYRAEGDYVQSKACYEQTLRIAQEIGDRRFEGFAIGNMGTMWMDQGDYVRAQEHYEQTLHILRETGDRLYEGFTFSLLGTFFRDQGDYARAQAYFEETLAVDREVGSLILRVRALSDLSILYRDRDDSQTALKYAQQAVEAAQQSDTLLFEAMAQTALGYALEGLRRLSDAADAYQRVMSAQVKSELSDLTIDSLAGLARIVLAQDDLPQAQAYVEQVLKHLEARPPDRMREPFLTCLTCYRVLRASQDPRAQDVLSTAHQLLQERATKINDEELRRSFLEDVPAHRETVREFVQKEHSLNQDPAAVA